MRPDSSVLPLWVNSYAAFCKKMLLVNGWLSGIEIRSFLELWERGMLDLAVSTCPKRPG